MRKLPTHTTSHILTAFPTCRSTGFNRDPTDAAQVPPSVLKKTLGDPQIEHDDHHHGRERRNSSATHQETYRGI